jgi:hypothetical protein
MNAAELGYRVSPAQVQAFLAQAGELRANELLGADGEAVDEVAEAFPEGARACEPARDLPLEHRG